MKHLFIPLAALILGACASQPPMGTPEYDAYMKAKAKEQRIEQIKDTIDGAPAWYKESASVAGYFVANGTDASNDMQFAIDKAMMVAKIAIASQVNSHITSTMKLYVSESGVGQDAAMDTEVQRVAKEVVAEVKIHDFEVSQHMITRDGTLYRAYVQLKMPKGRVSSGVLSSVKKREDLSVKLERSAAFKQLEADIEKFRAKQNTAQ